MTRFFFMLFCCIAILSLSVGKAGAQADALTADGDSVVQAELSASDISVRQNSPLVYVIPVREDIMPSTQRLVSKCLGEAESMDADYVVIDMNTYGGLVGVADSIRTRILYYPKPVYVFINNQAASAGALIAIAADTIFMREGASIGAATVVDQTGAAAPDKYQSFMRGMMRSTAESHGKVPGSIVRGDTVWRWFRDPLIAEAMVDPRIEIPGLTDSSKVVTLSANEAIEWGYCEGKAASVGRMLEELGLGDAAVVKYEPTWRDSFIGWLTNPALQGVLIMLVVAGIYFELKTPGIGFPMMVAVVAAALYFAPLYLDGVLDNWEIIVFIIGIILIALEIFVTPGFGVLGVAGAVAVVTGLAFAMIDADLLKYIPTGELSAAFVLKPLFFVIIFVAAGLTGGIWLGRKILTAPSPLRERIVLTSNMDSADGFVSHRDTGSLVGLYGTTATELRPSGKVMIEGALYEAAGDNGIFIERGRTVMIVRSEGGVLYCKLKSDRYE